MNKKILAGLIVFLVSFSVSAESVFGDLTGKYQMDIVGKDPAKGIILFEETGRVVLTSLTGDELCSGSGVKQGDMVEINLSCDHLKTAMQFDLSSVSDFEQFSVPIIRTITAWGVQISKQANFERLEE